MVALLVQLKLALLRGSLRQSVWRVVGLVVAALFGLGFLVAGTIGLVAARWLAPSSAASVVVLGGAALVLGWALLPLLVFGTDETLDPGRFAVLPLSARQLLPGLLVSGLVGVPGTVTALLALTTVVTWSRDAFTVGVALVGGVLGVLTCLLCARTLTSAFAELLGSRRFKDLASVVLALALASLGIAMNGLAPVLGAGDDGRRLDNLTTAVGWTPLGWAWSAPAAAATGHPLLAVARLGLAAGLVVLLTLGWERFLARRLVSPLTASAGPARVRAGRSRLDDVLPATPAGAVAMRSLRYLRRDPRYIASVGGVLIAPIALVVSQLVTTGASPWLVWAPVSVSWLVGVSCCQDTSYDGSALWLHVSSGITGATDRTGRALSQLIWSVPLVLLTVVAVGAITQAWDRLPTLLGLVAATLLSGIGAGAWVSARWQGPVAPPGANPFGSGSGASAASLLAVLVSGLLVLAATAPVLAVAIASHWVGWLGLCVLVLGPLSGLAVLRAGIRAGGRLLDGHWPEVLHEVSRPLR